MKVRAAIKRCGAYSKFFRRNGFLFLNKKNNLL
jgi:ribosomal protein L36